MVKTEEFLNGWVAAQSDDFNGNAKRNDFPSYRTVDFINGYRSFWDNQEDEIAIAEMDCIADYDAGAGAKS
jgi:hypothetical protein